MLTLTSKEVSSLRSDELKRMKMNVKDYFLKHSSKYIKNIKDSEFNDKIDFGIKRASRYELNTEYSLIKYIELMLKYSDQFDDQPTIRRMLADEEKPANKKLDAVIKSLTEKTVSMAC